MTRSKLGGWTILTCGLSKACGGSEGVDSSTPGPRQMPPEWRVRRFDGQERKAEPNNPQ
jgi:hypothetical protein